MTSAYMSAISQDILGGPEVLHTVHLPRPVPRATEVLVRVHAAGINPTDVKHRSFGLFLDKPPFTLGWDVSGVVEEVGLGAALYKPGDEVFGMLDYPGSAGAYAEYVVAPSRRFARKPHALSHFEAAAVPLAALTAWQAIVDIGHVKAGQRVLIHAASGGVGHFAVQIAKSIGAHTIGTASSSKHAFLRDLGLDEAIDYTQTDFSDALRDIDFVLDPIGADYGPRSIRTMRSGGTLVSLAPRKVDPHLAEHARTHGIRSETMIVESDFHALSCITSLLESGGLAPHISAVYPLADAGLGHRMLESGRTAGKLVLDASSFGTQRIASPAGVA